MMKYFLGNEVTQSEDGIFINKTKYENDVLKWFRMMNCKPIVTGTQLNKEDDGSKFDPVLYNRLVGSLMDLYATRTDIKFAVSLISIFMESPKNTHWKYGKTILR